MNSKEQYVAAIDVGTTKIVSIIGKRNETGSIEIVGLEKEDSFGVKRGVVNNIKETAESIKKSFDRVQADTQMNFSDVFVGIAGQHIDSIKTNHSVIRENPSAEIEQEEIDKLINDMKRIPLNPGDEIIHIIPRTFIVDDSDDVKDPVGMFGSGLGANFHIVTGKITAAQNIERCLDKAGLHLTSLMLEPLASSDAVLTDDEREAGVAMIDIGGGTTDLAIYYNNVICHTAVIPIGGDIITEDIKTGCSILGRYAEQIKVKYGSAFGDIAPENSVVSVPGFGNSEPKEISFRSLSFIIQARMEEIIDAIKFEIDNSGYADKLVAGIVITGGGAKLRNLPQLMKFKLGMDVRIGYPNQHIGGKYVENINDPMYATAIGLIIKGFDYYDKHGYVPNVRNMEIEKPVVDIEDPVEKEPREDKPTFIQSIGDMIRGMFSEEVN